MMDKNAFLSEGGERLRCLAGGETALPLTMRPRDRDLVRGRRLGGDLLRRR